MSSISLFLKRFFISCVFRRISSHSPTGGLPMSAVQFPALLRRVLTRLEFVVRQRLAAAHTGLAGLYGGNPQRTTARPTTERLLKPLQGLTLTIIREGRRRRYHLTPLSRVQRRILALLTFAVDISTRLCPDSHQPP
jgi:hypothetical protein